MLLNLLNGYKGLMTTMVCSLLSSDLIDAYFPKKFDEKLNRFEFSITLLPCYRSFSIFISISFSGGFLSGSILFGVRSASS